MYKILIICILLVIIFYFNLENFYIDEETLYIDYYVIHMSSNLERKKNIETMKNKINKNIKHFEAINGKQLLLENYNKSSNTLNNFIDVLFNSVFLDNINTVDLNKIKSYDSNIVFNFNYKYINEVGCYLSHLLLIKSLLNTEYKYTIIFEDDFNILNNNFNDDIYNILNKINIDFDLLYISNLCNNHGTVYKDEIYEIDINNNLHGTAGYIINNKNINKIYNNLLIIDLAIDNKYEYLIKNNILKAYVIYPIIVGNINTKSTIH